MELILATNNPHKKEELSRILSPHIVLLPRDVGTVFNFPENGITYFENAYGKALTLFNKIGRPVVADDSGLSVTALGGAPGLYSARYGEMELGKTLNQDERNKRLLENLKDTTDRRAFFVCSMVLILSEYRFFSAQETIRGEIVFEPTGMGGFGYDPVFFIPEYGKTMAQIPADLKNSISHRGKAGLALKTIIERERSK